MRILITNDDSISSPVLLPLAKWAAKHGEVTVVVPKYEQSGKSHGIELHKPFEVVKVPDFAPGIEAYTVDSTPADCVRLAILGLKMEVDLVISGINRGLNIGRDIMYSGTVSAVFEAGNLGVKAMAVSTSPAYYETAAVEMDKVWDYFQKHDLFAKNDMYNVNIPTGGSDEFRVTRQGGNYYSDQFRPEENDMYFPCGIDVFAKSDSDEFDTDAVLVDQVISVMPITLDRTNLELYKQLREL
jgi:5'-nucleotidase